MCTEERVLRANDRLKSAHEGFYKGSIKGSIRAPRVYTGSVKAHMVLSLGLRASGLQLSYFQVLAESCTFACYSVLSCRVTMYILYRLFETSLQTKSRSWCR